MTLTLTAQELVSPALTVSFLAWFSAQRSMSKYYSRNSGKAVTKSIRTAKASVSSSSSKGDAHETRQAAEAHLAEANEGAYIPSPMARYRQSPAGGRVISFITPTQFSDEMKQYRTPICGAYYSSPFPNSFIRHNDRVCVRVSVLLASPRCEVPQLPCLRGFGVDESTVVADTDAEGVKITRPHHTMHAVSNSRARELVYTNEHMNIHIVYSHRVRVS